MPNWKLSLMGKRLKTPPTFTSWAPELHDTDGAIP